MMYGLHVLGPSVASIRSRKASEHGAQGFRRTFEDGYAGRQVEVHGGVGPMR